MLCRAEEVKYQLEVREEMTVLESALAAVKRDYEVLRMEYERTVASNEQAGPVAKELRVTVDSLQKTISQHKSEVSRYKTRAHKAEQQLAKVGSIGCDCECVQLNSECSRSRRRGRRRERTSQLQPLTRKLLVLVKGRNLKNPTVRK